ncbi:hypothetical protein [Pseudomonas sp. F(2018)]|uniref:hypothetical protein n=1 Tax=Pseudomonas sp. F(2018) TaxID=2502240 RepID=UPI0010F7FDAA|nr:hypothetical protein [Pseudomonas sp. F(2018)]
MKVAHAAIIKRAESEGLFPAEMASELLEHDLVQLTLDQLQGQTAVYGSLSEQGQQEVIERVTLGVKAAVKMAIRIIAANGAAAVPVDVKRVQVDEKKLTVTLSVDGKDPRKHDLVDSAGRLCMLVMAPDEYGEGLDGITPDRDQKELPLSAAELAAGMGLTGSQQPEQPESGGAGNMLDDLNSLNDPTIEDVTRLVRESGGSIDLTFLQQHLAVDSSKATSLLFQLVEDGVIAVENSDAANSADYTYKVLPLADAS